MDFKDYRRGVGMLIINHEKKIFIGQRFDKDESAWQMPQGGIDNNETPEETCIRELAEENGIVSNYKILDKTKNKNHKRIISFGNIKIDLNKLLIIKNLKESKINNTEKKIL